MDELLKTIFEIYGTKAEVARRVGITRSGVGQWTQVPPWAVLQIEADTGISRHDLRPDVFGPSPIAKRAPRRRGNGKKRGTEGGDAKGRAKPRRRVEKPDPGTGES